MVHIGLSFIRIGVCHVRSLEFGERFRLAGGNDLLDRICERQRADQVIHETFVRRTSLGSSRSLSEVTDGNSPNDGKNAREALRHGGVN